MDVMVFGDSVAYGAWDPEGGWVCKLRKFLDKEVNFKLNSNSFYYFVYNLGVSDDTSADLLSRFKHDAYSRTAKDEGQLVIFEIGKNDSMFVKSKGDFQVPPKRFERNVKELIRQAQRLTQKIAFVSLLPVDERKTCPYKDASKEDMRRGIYYKNEHIEKYNSIIEKACRAAGVKFIDMYEKVSRTDYKQLLDVDGLHPNEKGHEAIFRMVKDELLKNKMIRLR